MSVRGFSFHPLPQITAFFCMYRLKCGRASACPSPAAGTQKAAHGEVSKQRKHRDRAPKALMLGGIRGSGVPCPAELPGRTQRKQREDPEKNARELQPQHPG